MDLNEYCWLNEICWNGRLMSQFGEESKWWKGLLDEYGTMYYGDIKNILTLGSLKDYVTSGSIP